jgi:hypothetical protein
LPISHGTNYLLSLFIHQFLPTAHSPLPTAHLHY